MSGNKLTPEQVKKALECCNPSLRKCIDCPFFNELKCHTKLAESALDYINHLETKNENYSHNIKKLTESNMQLHKEAKKLNENHKAIMQNIADVKIKVIKEFAQQLKERFLKLEYRAKTPRKTIRIEELQEQMDWVLHSVSIETIDNLLKEKTGDCK